MTRRLAILVLSSLLFVCGVGFAVAGARALRRPPQASAAVLAPVGSVTHIMRGIVDPAATRVFEAVGTLVTAAGVEEKAPRTQAEWDAVADSAAALAEAGNLLLMGSRVVDKGDWTTSSRKLIESGGTALRAAEAKDAEGVFAAGEAIYDSCESCHSKYRRTQ